MEKCNVKPVKVSVITVTYNCVNSISKTVESVLAQTDADIEYIIIDGQSDDGTIEKLKRYKNRIDCIISEKDRGIADAFNKGIGFATGELVFFLNAGDTFVHSAVVSRAVSMWEKEKPDVLFYKVRVGEKTYIPAQKYGNNAEKIWDECQVPHQGAFVRREVFETVGRFNTFLKIRMDYDFFARCKMEGCYYKYVPEIIVEYEIGGMSMNIDNAQRFYCEGMGIKLIYNLPVSMKDYCYYLVPRWMRKLGRVIMGRD